MPHRVRDTIAPIDDWIARDNSLPMTAADKAIAPRVARARLSLVPLMAEK
jgi:hypothetical protein